jgi:hypothetical protein
VADVVDLRRGTCRSEDPAWVFSTQLFGAAFEVLAASIDSVRFLPHHVVGIVVGDERGPAGPVGFVEDLKMSRAWPRHTIAATADGRYLDAAITRIRSGRCHGGGANLPSGRARLRGGFDASNDHKSLPAAGSRGRQ